MQTSDNKALKKTKWNELEGSLLFIPSERFLEPETSSAKISKSIWKIWDTIALR